MASLRIASVEHTKHTIIVCSSEKHCIQLHANSINLISIHGDIRRRRQRQRRKCESLYMDTQWYWFGCDLFIIRFYSIAFVAHFLCFIDSQYIYIYFIIIIILFFPVFLVTSRFSQFYTIRSIYRKSYRERNRICVWPHLESGAFENHASHWTKEKKNEKKRQSNKSECEMILVNDHIRQDNHLNANPLYDRRQLKFNVYSHCVFVREYCLQQIYWVWKWIEEKKIGIDLIKFSTLPYIYLFAKYTQRHCVLASNRSFVCPNLLYHFTQFTLWSSNEWKNRR